MNTSVVYLKQIAASGTDSVIIPITNPCRNTEIATSVYYGTQAATSGVNVHMTYSLDGTTYNAANGYADKVVLPAVAGTIQTLDEVWNEAMISGVALKVKLAFTNNDASNAATVCVEAQTNY